MSDTAPGSTRSPTPPERIKSSAEDPDTAATRKEFDNTAISEKQKQSQPAAAMASSSSSSDANPDGQRKATPEIVPPPAADSDRLKEQISSPKKKRAHDEVDQHKDASQDPNGDVSPIGADGASALGRNNRLEPEKKRHRDTSTELKDSDASTESTDPTKKSSSESKADEQSAADEKTKATSSSAFMSSGLSSFSGATSAFLQAGSKPLTSFASASASPSIFGASPAAKSETPSLFGSSSSSTNGASPFGQLGGAAKPFGGSVLGGGFGSGLSSLGGSKLTSFAKPGEGFKRSKPNKAFGAPESDPESGDEEGGEEEETNEAEVEKQDKEEKEAENDKKKTKLQRVAIDNGEAGEATILQVRAKIFHLDKTVDPVAWKERGAGNLKINVPESCIDIDDNGAPIPGSFDASALEDSESKTVRLVMRQDSTHRVILNTAVIPAMKFQEKPMNKTVCVLFTAIEGGGEAVSIQLKLNPTNAKSFLNEVSKIQRELQSN
ncbi:hypothetical protein BX600DRAFT_2380 [Xylariales sp. PMI_506]|nr:hypothetical protein BX600DRAFT_2380 [Xylariales sp. PMI_506]